MKRDKGPKLSKRLEAVKEFAGKCEAFADIGSDHALLPISMVVEGRCGKAIVTDLRKGPLSAAERNIESYCPDRKELFSLRRGSGLSVIRPGEADLKAICGMGGLLIAEIIENDFEVACEGRLILQPNTAVPELRCFLWEKGFAIGNEKGIVEDGHAYTLIDCSYTGEKRSVSPDSLAAVAGEFIGRDGDPEGIEYLKAVRKKYEAALNKITGTENARDFDGKAERRAELESMVSQINEIIGEKQ
ncbi:MAG: class I SAM-dependent methyltransferase [Clostridia bacterium]|nr:class I SAM-dependent methyltransferase [Clostridia bacterium]